MSSQNCQGCFPGREKQWRPKKKKGKEIRTEVVTWLLRPTRCFKPNFSSYFISYLYSIFLWFSHTGKTSFQKTHGLSHPNSVSFLMLFIHLKMLPPLFLSHLTKILVKYNLFHEAFSDSPDRICCPFQCIFIVSISSFQTEIISWLTILNAFWV